MNPISFSLLQKTRDAINGDNQALAELFEWYKPNLYTTALQICGNSPTAKDILQDTYITAITNIKKLRDPGSVYSWMRRILIHHGYHIIQRNKKCQLIDPLVTNDLDCRYTAESEWDQSSNQELVFMALKQLSEELLSCVMLRYYSKSNSYNDIALILGIPVGTVRSRLAAARDKMMKFLPAYTERSDEAARMEANAWTDYYWKIMTTIYDVPHSRNDFFNHFNRDLSIQFTSGKKATGRTLFEKEIDNDLYYGSRMNLSEVFSGHTITVVEGNNFNHPDYPDRCAPDTTLVFVRHKDKVQRLYVFDSNRDDKTSKGRVTHTTFLQKSVSNKN